MARLTIDLVNLIRTNLKDRYKDDLAILKEFIQNADDANANSLYIGWIEEPESNQVTSDYNLLSSPALIILNDAELTEKDAVAICRMGINYKSGDSSSIGKFGYGLKSVFHLCEAFFFVASNGKKGILSPWFGDNYPDYPYKDWETEDPAPYKYIENYVLNLLRQENLNTKDWFCIWIPLRLTSHCDNDKYVIEDKFLGKNIDILSSINGIKLDQEIIKALPLLKSLKQIKIWQAKPKVSDWEKCIKSIVLSTNSQQQMLVKNAYDKGTQISIRGSIKTLDNKEFTYAGYEYLLNENIESWQKEQGWPRINSLDLLNYSPTQQPETAKPHCAVIFSENPANIAELSVSFATFIPLTSNEEPIKLRLNLSRSFSLILHGYFFIDAGRQTIKLGDDNIEKKWNNKLLEDGIYQLILPALNDFVKTAKLDIKTTESLTKALANSKIYKEHYLEISSRYKWLYCIDSEGGCWHLFDKDCLFYELPKTENPAIHFLMFPKLTALIEKANNGKPKHLITFEDWPRLSSENATKWPTEIVSSLIESIEVKKVFSKQNLLDYLIAFLTKVIVLQDNLSINYFKNFIKKILQNISFDLLEDKKEALNKILDLLPKNLCLPLSTTNQIEKAVISDLNQLDLSCILIVDELILPNKNNENNTKASLSLADIEKIFAYIQSKSNQLEYKNNNLLVQFIKLSNPEINVLLNHNLSDCSVFKAKNYKDDTQTNCSLKRLGELKEKGLLFPKGSKNETLKLVYDVLVEKNFVEIDEHLSKLLKVIDPNIDTYLNILDKRPLLENNFLKRQELFEQLINDPKSFDDSSIRSLRYLLHANPKTFYSNDVLLIEQEDIWSKLAKSILEDQKWRILPKSISDNITRRQKIELKIEIIDKESFKKLLYNSPNKSFNNLTLDDEESDLLLKEDLDKDIWLKLPIHADSKGQRVSISNNTFLDLESDFIVDHEILEKILVIIPKHIDEVIKFKQEKYIERLTPNHLLKEFFKQPNPNSFYLAILQILEFLHRSSSFKNIDKAILETLKSTKWLQTNDGNFVSPKDITYIDGLEDEILAITGSKLGFITIAILPKEIWEDFSDALKQILAELKINSLENLSLVLMEEQKYRIGEIAINNEQILNKFLEVFREGTSIFPVVPLLDKINSLNICNFEDYKKFLLEPIQNKLSVDKTINIFNFLEKKHREAVGKQKEAFFEIHKLYLRHLIIYSHGDITTILKKIKLLNEENEWVSTAFLCDEASGITPAYLLNKSQKEAISFFLAMESNYSTGGRLPGSKGNDSHNISDKYLSEELYEKSFNQLKEYVKQWEPFVTSEVIGAFLALLGGYKRIEELAKTYLGNHSVEGIRSSIGWAKLPNTVTKGGQSSHQVMQTQRFIIKITEINDQETTVGSIVGNEFTAKTLSYQDIEDIFIGDKNQNFITNLKLQNKLTTNDLILRALSQHDLQELQKVNTKKPSDILKKSATTLLKKIYAQNADLDNLWVDLDKSEQFDLKVTQWLILESLFSSYFIQLKSHNKNSEIKNLYNPWKNIKSGLGESETFSNPEEKEKYRHNAIEEERKLKNHLQDLLETDSSVQNDLLKAVKEKIENHYRYTKDSIPFELFQNADDANVELKEIYTPKTIPNKPQFVIHIKGQTISFIHWGRMINQYRGNNEFDGKSKGFNNDLEKMLTLAASEKEDIENLTLTGKFGLGFKSVFLATDVPKIISGRLSFQVLAGVYPKLLPSEQIDELKSIIKAYEENKQTTTKATIISLDLAKDRASSEEVLKRFLSLFSFLLVFAKQINQCEIYNNSTITKASWKKHHFLEAKKVFIGELHELYESKFSHIKKLLVFEGQDSAIAISITPNGCISLDDIPSIWVTAPTKEETRFGFAINGHFALDIGRTQLPIDDTKNRELALKIGKDIGTAFCEFFQSCERNQTEFYNLLELSEYHRNNYYFWESFWKLLTDKFKENSNSLNEATLLITIILWGSNDSGLAKLYSACNSLPNMLYDNYKALTKFDLVKFCTSGLLEEEPIFKTVSQWDVFKQEIKPQEIISKTKVKVVIENVENILSKVNIKIANLSGTCWNIINSKEVNLYEVLKWITKQGYEINPAQASLLGEIFNPDLINKYSKQYREETNKQNKQYKEEVALH